MLNPGPKTPKGKTPKPLKPKIPQGLNTNPTLLNPEPLEEQTLNPGRAVKSKLWQELVFHIARERLIARFSASDPKTVRFKRVELVGLGFRA